MIVVTGATGQLGFELRRILNNAVSGHSRGDSKPAIFLDSKALNLRNPEQIKNVLADLRPTVLINAAAYTQVDKAESEPEIAQEVNVNAPAHMARLAHDLGFRFIHISTDYVFDGRAREPYTEDSPISPQNIYGQTKATGERAVLEALPSALIVRTSWVYSSHGHNFVKTVLRLAKERKYLRVVFDQVGSLTYAHDLAQTLLRARDLSGIYHFSNEGVSSWYDVACAVKRLKNLSLEIEPILTRDYPTPAKRPLYSVLDKSKLKSALNLKIPHWMESLEKCLKEIS